MRFQSRMRSPGVAPGDARVRKDAMHSSTRQPDQVTAKLAFLVFGLFAVCVYTAFILSTRNIMLVSGIVIAAGLFIFGFLSPRIALYLLIFSMLLSPEIGARDYSGRGFTIRFEDILLLVMGFAWLAKSALVKNIGVVTRTPLNIPILLYIVVCILSTLKGIFEGTVTSPVTGFFFVLKYFEYFVIFFLTVNNIRSREHIRNLLLAIFITYIIVLANGLMQIPQGVRITAPFEGESSEPNTLGGYLLIMFSLTAVLFFSVTGTIRRTAVGILAGICLIAILYTLSRATWLGFFPLYLALIVLMRQRNALIGAFLIGFAILPFTLPETIVDRFTYTFSGNIRDNMLLIQTETGTDTKLPDNVDPDAALPDNISFDSSTAARLYSMRMAFRDFLNRPILGYGVTGYDFLDAQYHRVLIETGVLGLILFLFLLWRIGQVLLDLRKRYGGDPLYTILITGTFCALVGLMFHAIGTNTFIIVRIMEPFWCLLGLCLSIPLVEENEIPGAGSDSAHPAT